MAERSSTFQTVILIAFIALTVLGVAAFALFSGGGSEGDFSEESVEIWGTESSQVIGRYIESIRQNKTDLPTIKYTEKDPEGFDLTLIEALASGKGPDMFILPHDQIFRFEDKIFTIPYESYPERTFKDHFVEGAEIFLSEEGVLAFPVLIDPVVMYWNRDILSSEGFAERPAFWDELFNFAEKVTRKDEALNIERSAVALGEYTNISHAKEILSALIMQAGSPIVGRQQGRFVAVLSQNFGFPTRPAVSALRFYTEFSNPTKTTYSWNRSLPNSKEMFLSGDLAVYFGKASEIRELREKNPNLNFDVSVLPQIRDFEKKLTYGDFKGIAILKASGKVRPSFAVMVEMTSDSNLPELESKSLLPPIRRSLLSKEPRDAFMSVFYDSALIAKAFRDPDPRVTGEIFKGMVERVISGRSRISESVDRADRELNDLLVEKRN